MQALLEHIEYPEDLRKVAPEDLPRLCSELRSYLRASTEVKEEHIRSSLGVTELSTVIHYRWDTPRDILIWDVGHQAYIHKILTGRKILFSTNRQPGGLSGFTRRQESRYDPFGAGHSSTAISALAGFAAVLQPGCHGRRCLAVVGDGALTGGMSFEALNYIGEQAYPCTVVLNDNRSSIDANVGALQQNRNYREWAQSLGFTYLHTVQGNHCPALLEDSKKARDIPGPVFWHVETQKPAPRESASGASTLSFQQVFGETVAELLSRNSTLQVLSPAMLSGAHLGAARQRFPRRVYDVGIAEQHAVTMAAGMAAAGAKVICHLYSTFAQRAMDQIIHDVALQELPVILALDRAGLVGPDGPTHHGAFDISLLAAVPGMHIWAPAHAAALRYMLQRAVELGRPVAIRYPKTNCPEKGPGKGKFSLQPQWWIPRGKACVISIGSLAGAAQEAAERHGWAHLHLPVIKPFPGNEVLELLSPFSRIITVEESSFPGGLGSQMCKLLHAPSQRRLKNLHLPDHFVEHGPRPDLLAHLGLDEAGIAEAMRKMED